jgi:hypothetical protein
VRAARPRARGARQDLFRLVCEAERVGVHLLHNEPWRGPGLLHLFGHELDGL